MLVHKQQQIKAHVLHNNKVKCPKDFFLFCSVHQFDGDDVRWTLPIYCIIKKILTWAFVGGPISKEAK
mgnify:CR=1 FL=1